MLERFADLFSLRRRCAPRVAVDWMVDLEVPHSEPTRYVGLLARDISARGIRLEGGDDDAVRRLLSEEGRVRMKLRLPTVRPPLPRVEAELCWGMGEPPHFRTGWSFTHVDAQVQKYLDEYIAAHSQDIVEEG